MPGNALVGNGVSGIASLLMTLRSEPQAGPEFGIMALDQDVLKLIPDSMPDVWLPPGESTTGGYVTLQYLAFEPTYVTTQALVGVSDTGDNASGTSLTHTHNLPATPLESGNRVLLVWVGNTTAVILGVISPRDLTGSGI